MENYTSQLRSFLEETKGNAGSRCLDMSKAAHRSLAAAMYGGMGNLEKMSPRLHRMLRPEHPLQANGSLGSEPFFTDSVLIRQALYSSKDRSIFTSGRVSLAGKAEQMHVVVTILSKTGETLGRQGFFTRNNGFLPISYTRESLAAYPEGATVVYHVSYIPASSNELRSTVFSQEASVTQNDVIDSLSVTDPIIKKSHSKDEIRITYARTPADKEQVDYSYPEKREPITQNQYFFLEMSGELKLKGEYTIDKIITDESGAAMSFVDAGDIFYENDFMAGIQINEKKDGFTWSFNKDSDPAKDKADWKHSIPMSKVAGDRNYFFDLYIGFRVLDSKGKKVKEKFYVMVTSDVWSSYKADNGYYAIPILHLFWGCLGENTHVKMADGSCRRISEIKMGDMVRTSEGYSRISNVFVGREPRILCVKAEGLEEIQCTDTHPFMTGSGMKAAKDLAETDMLVTETGTVRMQYCYPQDYTGQVFNLELEQGHVFYGNGYPVGDFKEQNRVHFSKNDRPAPETEEMKTLRNYFENLE